jgi:hypothetical protein
MGSREKVHLEKYIKVNLPFLLRGFFTQFANQVLFSGYDVKENRPVAIKEENPNVKNANLLDEYCKYNRIQDVPSYVTKLAYISTADSRSYLVFNLV